MWSAASCATRWAKRLLNAECGMDRPVALIADRIKGMDRMCHTEIL